MYQNWHKFRFTERYLLNTAISINLYHSFDDVVLNFLTKELFYQRTNIEIGKLFPKTDILTENIVKIKKRNKNK